MFHGVVFDGLDSVFANSFVHTLYSVLKALNNRKHIYAITLKNDFSTIKQQQAMLQAEKGDCFCYRNHVQTVSVHSLVLGDSTSLFTDFDVKGLSSSPSLGDGVSKNLKHFCRNISPKFPGQLKLITGYMYNQHLNVA